jgi:thymus-specific serine protease
MVAWMRLKYPHLVSGSWASSAPVNAQVDYAEYKDVMTDAIKRVGGDNCFEVFKNAFKQMEEVVETQNASRINRAFKLCLPLDLSQDVAHFFFETSDIVAGLVQTHRAGNIEAACDLIKREKEQNGKEDLEAFAAWVTHESIMCLDMSYKNSVKKFRNTEWGSEANRQMRQWT